MGKKQSVLKVHFANGICGGDPESISHYSTGVELKNILLILSGSFIRFIGRTYFLNLPKNLQ